MSKNNSSLNEKMFLEKIAILNENFLRHFQKTMRDMPNADYSPVVNAYLEHVRELDKMYSVENNSAPPFSISSQASSSATTIASKPSLISSFLEKSFSTPSTVVGPSTTAPMFTQTFNFTPVNTPAVSISNSFIPTPSFNTPFLTNGGNNNNLGLLNNSTPHANTNGGGDEDNNDEEQVEPPKAEEFEQVEEGAIFSAKCSVHNLVNGNYEKRGVAYISFKDFGEKRQLIIRAATAIGKVWTNTFVNQDLKWSKADKTRIKITYPLSSGAVATSETLLLKVSKPEELDSLVKILEAQKS